MLLFDAQSKLNTWKSVCFPLHPYSLMFNGSTHNTNRISTCVYCYAWTPRAWSVYLCMWFQFPIYFCFSFFFSFKWRLKHGHIVKSEDYTRKRETKRRKKTIPFTMNLMFLLTIFPFSFWIGSLKQLKNWIDNDCLIIFHSHGSCDKKRLVFVNCVRCRLLSICMTQQRFHVCAWFIKVNKFDNVVYIKWINTKQDRSLNSAWLSTFCASFRFV